MPTTMLHKLYDKMLAWSAHKNAVPILWITSIIDAIFFPIPPLVMLLPMMLARPKKSFSFAFATIAGSIIGGLIAYSIGYFFSAQLEPIITNLLGGEKKFSCLKAIYGYYGFVALLLWGFLPVPYKVITWASGFLYMPLWIFITASILGRSVRYFAIAAAFYFFGAPAKKYIDRHFNQVTYGSAAVILLLAIWYFTHGSGVDGYKSFLPSVCS
ncbi:MAG: YqaA family protein [Alphaproteobacteria bacterium]